jgi:predicted GNAT family N-acyltransferase
MLVTTVSTDAELQQISLLNELNLKKNISEKVVNDEGFVSWEYDFNLLKALHSFSPSVIAKENDNVVGYSLVAVKEAKAIHQELAALLNKIEGLTYKDKELSAYNYYLMGQVCIDKPYRGHGLFNKMFALHKALHQHQFDFVATTISTQNIRSIKAHEKVGFKIIHEITDHLGNWVLVIWDWGKPV